MRQIIIRNAVRCNHCGDMIDSNYTHDFKACSCGIEKAEADYAKAADELARAQTALDTVNTTVEFEL